MSGTAKQSRAYSPALGVDWLLPLYDPILRAVIPEEAIKRQLVALAAIQPGDVVVDLGCGTATLSVLIKAMQPAAEVVGLDPDAKALERARQKAAAAGLAMRFDLGFATALPYADASVDRVLSAFVFHHLPSEAKRATLREVLRVLKPGAAFCVLDFGQPPTRLGRLLAPLLHPGRDARDNIRGRLPALMREAGFADVHEAARRTLIVGSVSHLVGRRP
ncbi:methyltransferase domain-containing protein [bacterium]|nr:methyltransferase domain-containing protein [bacterium]